MPRYGVRTQPRGRTADETLQRHRTAGSGRSVRHVRSGTGKRTGGAPSPNLCGFRRKQRTEREDMGAVCLAERQTSAAGRRNQPVPCACLPHGGTMLPAPASVSRNVERTLACRYFPHDAGRSALLCSRCRAFLSRTTRDDARRADIQPTKIGGKQPFKAVTAGIRLLADFHPAV